jgi:hypothetical protein
MANWRNTVLGTMILRRGIQNRKSLWLSPKAFSVLSGRQDSNLRPPGPKPGALPACATSRAGRKGKVTVLLSQTEISGTISNVFCLFLTALSYFVG